MLTLMRQWYHGWRQDTKVTKKSAKPCGKRLTSVEKQLQKQRWMSWRFNVPFLTCFECQILSTPHPLIGMNMKKMIWAGIWSWARPPAEWISVALCYSGLPQKRMAEHAGRSQEAIFHWFTVEQVFARKGRAYEQYLTAELRNQLTQALWGLCGELERQSEK